MIGTEAKKSNYKVGSFLGIFLDYGGLFKQITEFLPEDQADSLLTRNNKMPYCVFYYFSDSHSESERNGEI